MSRLLLLVSLLMGTSGLQAEAVSHKTQTITISLTQEPPSLDSLRTTDLVSFFVLGHVNEGLVRYGRRGEIVPGVAKSWDVTAEQMTFRLRSDARWSDGAKMVASDFVYAWRQLNDPAFAAPFATIMHPIKNAVKVQAGELPVSALGISAPNEQTLVVELESPCGYCLALMVHPAFFPVRREFRERLGNQYGAEASSLLYNGPFMLTEWVHGTRLTLQKNPNYWNRDAIHLNEIRVGYITEDNRTRLNLFRDERIALVRLGAETVRDAAKQNLRLRTFASGGVAYLSFNVRSGRPLADLRLRQAIQAVFDADEFVNKVIAIPGYRPAYSFFPSWLPGESGSFTEEYPLDKALVDVLRGAELARQALSARTEHGVPPTLTLLTVTSPTGARIAEYFQGLISRQLGIAVKVDQQTFKQYLQKARQGEFDIALSSWYPDFGDVVTYADLLASWNPNNRGRYANDAYDELLSVLLRSADPFERMRVADQLQRIIQADVPILPMAETGSAYIVHPQLRGVVRRVLGADPDYTFARVVPPADR